MPRSPLLLIGAALVTSAVVGVGVAGTSSVEEPVVAPKPAPVRDTALADVDTTMLTVARAGFCDAVDPVLVNRALGLDDDARGVRLTTYANGDRAQLNPSLSDVSHEFGCTWDGKDVLARAWVFAPPVTEQQAEALLDATTGAGCEPIAGAAAFGRPSTAQVCPTAAGPQASYRGLFGDAWLTCTLTADLPDDVLLRRADTWCAAIALAASR